MLKCKLCRFECTFRTQMDSHLRVTHGQHIYLDQSEHFKNSDDDIVTDVQLPYIAAIISPDFSGGGGDFGGGGASSDY